MHRYEHFGDFAGEAARPENFGEYLYFSTITYTSLGFGDVYPTGGLRMVAGMPRFLSPRARSQAPRSSMQPLCSAPRRGFAEWALTVKVASRMVAGEMA